MALTTTKRYYTRDNAPMVEVVTTNPANKVLSISNPYDEQTDTIITEEEYNTLITDQESLIESFFNGTHPTVAAAKADRQALIDSATVKLLALNFTEDEIKLIL